MEPAPSLKGSFSHVNIILNVLMLLTQSLHVVIKIICAQVLSKDSAQVLGFLAFGLQPLGLFHTKGLPWVPSGSVKSRGNLHLFYVEMLPSSISAASEMEESDAKISWRTETSACCLLCQGVLPSKGTNSNKSKRSYGEVFRHPHSLSQTNTGNI